MNSDKMPYQKLNLKLLAALTVWACITPTLLATNTEPVTTQEEEINPEKKRWFETRGKLREQSKKVLVYEDGQFYSIYSEKGGQNNQPPEDSEKNSPGFEEPGWMNPGLKKSQQKYQDFEHAYAQKKGFSTMEALIKSGGLTGSWQEYLQNPRRFLNKYIPKSELYDDPTSPLYFNPEDVPETAAQWAEINQTLQGEDGATTWNYLFDVMEYYLQQKRIAGGSKLTRTNMASQVNWEGIDTTGFDFFRINLSKSNINPNQINQAERISNAVLTGMDLTGIDFTGKDISGIVLQDTKGITGADINKANTIQSANLRGLDLTGLDLTGKNTFGINFERTNITAEQLNSASTFQSMSLSGLNLTGVNLNKNLQGLRMNNAYGIDMESLNQATNLSYAQMSGVDLTGFDGTGKNLTGINLQNAKNLDPEALNEAIFNQTPYTNNNPTLPRLPTNLQNVNLSGFNTEGRDLGYFDLRNTQITTEQLNAATNLKGVRLSGNFTGQPPIDFNNKDLDHIMLASVRGITGADLATAASIQNADLRNFDMAGFETNGKSLNGVNLASAKNVTADMLNNASDLRKINLTNIRSVKDVNTNGRNLNGANLTKTNITIDQLVQASNINGVVLTGTGITRAQLSEALLAAEKPMGAGASNEENAAVDLSTITF